MSSSGDSDVKYIYIPIKLGSDPSQSWSIRLSPQQIPTINPESSKRIELGKHYAADVVHPSILNLGTKQTIGEKKNDKWTAMPLLPHVNDKSEENCVTTWTNVRLTSSTTSIAYKDGIDAANDSWKENLVDHQVCCRRTPRPSSTASIRSGKMDVHNVVTKLDGEKWTNIKLSPDLNENSIVNPPDTFFNIEQASAMIMGSNDKDLIRGTLDAFDERACGSPESGIDCDDASSPHQINVEEEQLQPLDVLDKTDVKVSSSSSRDLISTSFPNSSELPLTTNRHITSDKEGELTLNILKYGGDGESLNKDPEVCPDINELLGSECCSDFQIISVHSLAPEQLPEFAHECSPERKNKVAETNTSNKPLPDCGRLYVRKIKSPRNGTKHVLFVEADYSHARSLPSWIMNKPIKKKPQINPISHAHMYQEDIVEVKVKRKNFTPKKNILKNNFCHSSRQSIDRNSAKKRVHVQTPSHQKEQLLDSTPFKKIFRSDFDEDEVLEYGQSSDTNEELLQSRLGTDELENKTTPKKLLHVVGTRSRPRSPVEFLSPSPKLDRIAQLRAKLRQKEADLEKIRKTMISFDDLPLG